MVCVMTIDDVPVSSRKDFASGVHVGGDIVRLQKLDARSAKEAAKLAIYGGETPYSTQQFWTYQGAIKGIHGCTEVCPNCSASDGDECRGPWL